MRSQFSFPLGIIPSLFSQTVTSDASPAVLQVTVKFVLVLQSDVCKGSYKPGHNDCSVTTQEAEFLEKTHRVSRAYPLSAGKSVALALERKFHGALISCIDAGHYAVLLNFDWGSTLVAAVDMIRDSSKPLSKPLNTPRHPDRSQYWHTHQNAIDFDPDKSVRWKVTLNDDLWYGFYVVPAV
jgi:hypothetical protein